MEVPTTFLMPEASTVSLLGPSSLEGLGAGFGIWLLCCICVVSVLYLHAMFSTTAAMETALHPRLREEIEVGKDGINRITEAVSRVDSAPLLTQLS